MKNTVLTRFTLVAYLFIALVVLAGGQSAAHTPAREMAGPLSATDGLPGIRYLHVSTSDNTIDNVTYLNHPLLNGEPNAILFVTQNTNAGGSFSGTINEHEIGVWYNDLNEQWATFNEDNADMPPSATFTVFVPIPDTNVFVHEATAGNSNGNLTYLDHPLLNNKPYARLLITQNWNPGGGLSGVYNPHVVGVGYIDSLDQWAILNQDGLAMPEGAAFNVLVAEPVKVFLPLILRES